MGAIQLFHATLDGARELELKRFQNEKELHRLFERHLHDLTDITFVASEHYTGSRHKRRADTLGLDDQKRPVVIEYKLRQGGAAISQGLDYLDWLKDHKGDFRELVRAKLGGGRVNGIDFKNAWLLCVAGEYRREDILSAQTNTHRIELLSVRRLGEATILLDWLLRDREEAKPTPPAPEPVPVPSTKQPEFSRCRYWRQIEANAELHGLFMALHDYLVSLGEDVRANPTKNYISFKRKRTVAYVNPQPSRNRLDVHIYVDLEHHPYTIGFTRKLHSGSYNMGIFIRNHEDLEKAKPLLQQSYQRSG